jgi:Asp-tRNA(Asn)/Glu-tRNA(Gln) amidotransferase A subunit family amidase
VNTNEIARRRFLLQALAGTAVAGSGLAGMSLPAHAESVTATPDQPDCDTLAAKVTERTIAETEKLHHLNFTAAEREAIVQAVPGQWAAIDAVRTLPRERDLQPALTFDPRLPGVNYPAQQNRVQLAASSTPLPAGDDDIAFAAVTEQSEWIRSGQLSSLRLTEIYLKRIAQYAPRLLCYITVADELARQQAAAMDHALADGRWRGPLHGIPYGLKDVFDTAGIATTWGSSLFRDRVPGEDATIVTQLREAGAVLLGKVATAELANGATWFGGMCRNPWNPEEPAGGSSTGAGSAVAAGLCSFAIGTDSLGSIINPATRCGVVGLRPTFGRVPVTGGMPLTPSLERIGPLARTIDDAALVLAAINGPDPHSATSIDVGFAYDANTDLSQLRIGYSPRWWKYEGFWSESYLAGAVPVSAAQQQAFEAVRTTGAKLVEVELPDLPYGALMKILEVEAAYVFEDLTFDNRDDLLVGNAATWGPMWRSARMLSAVDYMQIERFRRQVMQAMHTLLTEVDMLFLPTYGLFDLVLITNMTGHPGLSWRVGFNESATRGLGFTPEDPNGRKHRITQNVCLHGRLFDEGRMLALARAVEQQLDVWRERPPLASA